MSNKKIRNFSAEEKTKIVLEILESEKTLAEISKQYEVTSKTLQNWKKQFLENASLAFEPAKVVNEYKKEIEELKEQNDELAWIYQIKEVLSIPSLKKYQWQDNVSY